MPAAMKLLGRPYYLEGVVEKGKQLGGKRLAPTVNIALSSDLLYPPNGVYISRTHVDGRAYASVTNLGRNPTIGGGETPRAETHILDSVSYTPLTKIVMGKALGKEERSCAAVCEEGFAKSIRKWLDEQAEEMEGKDIVNETEGWKMCIRDRRWTRQQR